MDISHYISRLLFKHDCVIVPDFGGFITNYFPANYNKELNVFVPPSKTIAFNSKLTVGDGLLANFISQCNQISYSEARIEIARFVDYVKKDLESGKKVSFNHIGSFTLQNDILRFIPDNSLNRLIDAFGLPVLQMPLSAQETVRPVFENISGNRKIVQKVLVAIPIVLALALLPMKMSKFSTQDFNSTAKFSNIQLQADERQNILNNPKSLSDVVDKMTDPENALYYTENSHNPVNNVIDSIIANTPLSLIDTIEEEEISIPEKTEIKPSAPIKATLDKKYYIIAGSFVEMSRVNVFCKELTNKNFNPEVVEKDGRLRISVGSFNNSQEANAELSRFRINHPEYPVWLLSL